MKANKALESTKVLNANNSEDKEIDLDSLSGDVSGGVTFNRLTRKGRRTAAVVFERQENTEHAYTVAPADITYTLDKDTSKLNIK